jgi:hypothetical protein
MRSYNRVGVVIFSALLTSMMLIFFAKIQMEIDKFWREKFKPDFLSFPANEVKITKAEMERVHLLYQYLALASSFLAMFVVIFVYELIELYRSYKKQDLVFVAS